LARWKRSEEEARPVAGERGAGVDRASFIAPWMVHGPVLERMVAPPSPAGGAWMMATFLYGNLSPRARTIQDA
jgi:hypothetical protein